MTAVIQLFQELPRDSRGRVIIEEGQKWLEKKTGTVWAISLVEHQTINDKRRPTMIWLEDEYGTESESGYTEKYFRQWFSEVGDARRRENKRRLRSASVLNLEYWRRSGLVVSK